MVSRARTAYRQVDGWLGTHWRVNLALFVVVPGAAWALVSVTLGGNDRSTAVLAGLTFGLVYATLTYFWGDVRDSGE